MANEHYRENRPKALERLKDYRRGGDMSAVRALQRDMSLMRQGRVILSFDLEYATVTLSDDQLRLLRDCLNFAAHEPAGWAENPYKPLSDMVPAWSAGEPITLTSRQWIAADEAVSMLEGMLQETLSYETFPERHRAFEELHNAVDPIR